MTTRRESTILVIDIGNTSTTLGLYDGNAVHRVHRLEKKDITMFAVNRTLRAVAGKHRIAGAALASVAPSVNRWWDHAVNDLFGCRPLHVTCRVDLGIKVTYPNPKTIGADRLANAAGAVVKYGAPVIVGDFGTAVTFDVVTAKEGYIGGIIAPGPPLMFDYLAERTELLPRIEWAPIDSKIGKSTREAMQLGAHWGYRGMFKEVVAELTSLSALRKASIIATGGFASRMLQGLKPAPVIDPDLTLFGIGCIYLRNAE